MTTGPANSLTQFWLHWTSLRHRIEFGDAVILIYIIAFVRQYLWIVNNKPFAWTVTILIAALLWLVHVWTKPDTEETTPSQFWLVVALPLFVVYAMRAAFPDTSFDVLDYRLMNGERALQGFPFLPGDFFAARFPFNPVSDMVTGITRHMLGYRLGTIINYLVVLWVGTVLNRLLRPYVQSVWLRCTAILLLLLTEHVLFLLSNYMVDLLALPLLLEATRLVLLNSGTRNQSHNTIRLAIYLGASVAFKLTNLAFALPIALVYVYRVFTAVDRTSLVRDSLLLLLGFAAPLLPFTLYIYWQTGNPVFPLYNKIFASPFWPTNDLVGVRWGPVVDDPRWANMRWWEVLLWPILLPFRLEHTAGDLGRHAGRLSLGFIAAICGMALKRTDLRIRYLSFIAVVAGVLWSAISGMHRYGILVELLGGIVIFYFVFRLYEQMNGVLIRTALALMAFVVVAQSVFACIYVYKFEWGSRQTVFHNFRAYTTESKYFLRDYSLPDFLPAREKALIDPARIWIESSALESGVQVLLKKDIPALCVYMPEFFASNTSKIKFESALSQGAERKMFSLSFAENLKDALAHLREANLGTGRLTNVVIPYFSDHTRIHMVLIEVLPPGRTADRPLAFTESRGVLPETAWQAEISWSQRPPTSFRGGLKETVYVKVRNTSEFTWPALGRSDGWYRLFLGNHWLDENNKIVVNDDARSILLYDLGPNEEIEVPITITAPEKTGSYVLEIDVVQENVAWFSSKGSKPLRTECKVE